MGYQGPDVHRGLWGTSTTLSVSSLLTSEGRRVPRNIPRRRLARPYLGTSLALFGIRERLGIQAETVAGRKARTCMNDLRREAGASPPHTPDLP
jgi:hypothetical protein